MQIVSTIQNLSLSLLAASETESGAVPNEIAAADIFALIVFVLAVATGLYYWLQYLKLPFIQKGDFLVDRSAPAKWGLLQVLVILGIWIVSQSIVYAWLISWNGLDPGKIPTGELGARFAVIAGIAQVVVVIGCFIFLMKRYRYEDSDFGLSRNQILAGIKAGLIGFVMWVPLVWLAQHILVYFIEYSHPSLDRIIDNKDLTILIDTWIAAVIVAPIVEEILFRGIIQGWLQRIRKESWQNPNPVLLGGEMHVAGTSDEKPQRRKKKKQWLHRPAIVITSLLFGLAHFSQGPAPISLFILSLGLGYLYQRTGSIIACIVMHMILNAVTLMVFTINMYS